MESRTARDWACLRLMGAMGAMRGTRGNSGPRRRHAIGLGSCHLGALRSAVIDHRGTSVDHVVGTLDAASGGYVTIHPEHISVG